MMSLRQSFLAVSILSSLAPLASAQTAEKTRAYGVNLGLDASRSWSNGGSQANNVLNASLSWLFLNENFHVGPAVSFARGYGEYFQSTTYGLGIVGKWTYENLQTTTATPFVEVTAGTSHTEAGSWSEDTNAASLNVGYEMFLNSFVSLAPSIIYSKNWSEGSDDSAGYETDFTGAEAAARLHLGLNIYL